MSQRRYPRIVTFSGTSQYRTGGISACGIAAMNCARLALSSERNGDVLLDWLLTKDTMQNIMSVCSQQTSDTHLEIDPDIYRVPLFEDSLHLALSKYGTPSLTEFNDLLSRMLTLPKRRVAVVITRPPEIICCIKIPRNGKSDVFVTLDSHPRDRYPKGAAFIVTETLEEMAAEVNGLLAVNRDLLSDTSLQWQAQLLAHYSGHFFTVRSSVSAPQENTHSIMKASLQVLALRAQVAQLKSQIELHRSISERSDREVEVWRTKYHQLKRTKETQLGPYCKYDTQPTTSTSNLAVLSRSSDLTSFAGKNQDPLGSEEMAIIMQRRFDEENLRLLKERKELERSVQKVFECGICFDKLPEDFIARIEPCLHVFCRNCIRQHVITKLDEHRFPILCPGCTSGENQSKIGSELVQLLGIPNAKFAIYEELQLSSISILVHCRKCRNGVFVDREEMQAIEIVVCPVPGCAYAWCKTCQQPIQIDGPQHSCDGSSELKHLMDEQGWKHCPGCQTPIQKMDGCNHMTCIARGCNIHFCYLCGEKIVRSTSKAEVNAAVSAHYSRCTLFQY